VSGAPQAKAYLAQPGEQLTGLNLLNTTNLDYFNPQHQAEVFRLKGLFHQVWDHVLCDLPVF
jgi:transformation/transcription domain-associated protein